MECSARERSVVWSLTLLVVVSGCGRIGVEQLERDAAARLDAGAGDAQVCALACLNPHGTSSCMEGRCVPRCDDGFEDCDGLPENGCETNLASDPRQCGACGQACSAASGSPVCRNGRCEVSSCELGSGECDGSEQTACETDLESSVEHCGFCGNTCAFDSARPACTNGRCELESCLERRANCDGRDENGCEIDVREDVLHCGTCGDRCLNAHGTTRCVEGTCAPTCDSGFGNCSGNPRDGCDTDLTTLSDCGRCGNACPAAGGVPVCDGATCSVCGDLSGVWAVKQTLQLTWSNDTLADGAGTAQVWSKLNLTQAGDSLAGDQVLCGIALPDYELSPTLAAERYGLIYPSESFDREPSRYSSAPAIITLEASSARYRLALSPTALLAGVSLADALTAPWPATAKDTSPSDDDGDGRLGVTAVYKTAADYALPAADAERSKRAAEAQLAARMIFSWNGALTSCTEASGTAVFSAVDSHIVSCLIADEARDCSAAERDFLDATRPIYSAGTASFALAKLADGAGCAQVRATLP